MHPRLRLDLKRKKKERVERALTLGVIDSVEFASQRPMQRKSHLPTLLSVAGYAAIAVAVLGALALFSKHIN